MQDISSLIAKPDPAYVWWAYGITAFCLTGLSASILLRHRRMRRDTVAQADAMEERGVDA